MNRESGQNHEREGPFPCLHDNDMQRLVIFFIGSDVEPGSLKQPVRFHWRASLRCQLHYPVTVEERISSSVMFVMRNFEMKSSRLTDHIISAGSLQESQSAQLTVSATHPPLPSERRSSV